MGLKNGNQHISIACENGLYHRRAKNYNIVFDGEYIRYKGLTEVNCVKHNAEEAIAVAAFEYSQNIIDKVQNYLGWRPKQVLYFMDGQRVLNKEVKRRSRVGNFDEHLIRSFFKMLCSERGYNVVQLDVGEAELQMYRQRDQTNVELNIFVTNDSDTLSIMYGHVPTIKYSCSTSSLPNTATTISTPTASTTTATTTTSSSLLSDDKERILIDDVSILEKFIIIPNHTEQMLDVRCKFNDRNSYYNDNISVLDSCVWLSTSRGGEIKMIGFDFICTRLRYQPLQFHTFIACCGTDFTNNLLTDSMINGILYASDEDVLFINTLTDIHKLIGCFLILGLRINGRLKLLENAEVLKREIFDANKLALSIDLYVNYITNGVMDPIESPQQLKMGLATRHYLAAMRDGNDCFTLNALRNWALNVNLSDVVHKLDCDTLNNSFDWSRSKIQRGGSSTKKRSINSTTTIPCKTQKIDKKNNLLSFLDYINTHTHVKRQNVVDNTSISSNSINAPEFLSTSIVTTTTTPTTTIASISIPYEFKRSPYIVTDSNHNVITPNNRTPIIQPSVSCDNVNNDNNSTLIYKKLVTLPPPPSYPFPMPEPKLVAAYTLPNKVIKM